MTQKISLGQTVILLFLCRVFNILNYIPTFSKKLDFTSALIGIVISTLFNFIFVLPAIVLLKKYDGQSIVTIAYQKHKLVGIAVAFIYTFFLFFNLLKTVLGFHFFITTAVFPNVTGFIIILSFCVVCFLCAQYGLEGLARTATIVFVLFVAVIAFIGITSITNLNLLNLSPAFHSPFSQVFESVFVITSRNAEIYLLLLLAPFVKGNITKGFFWYILATGLINFLLNFFIIGVLGEYAYSQTIPFFTLATISETKVLQRLDSIYMVIWVFISFVKVTTYIILITKCCLGLLPKFLLKYRILMLFLIITSVAIVCSNSPELVRKLSDSTGLVTFTLLVIIPLLLIPQKHSKGGNAYEETASSVANHSV